jgi:hypothetical protein
MLDRSERRQHLWSITLARNRPPSRFLRTNYAKRIIAHTPYLCRRQRYMTQKEKPPGLLLLGV